MKFHIQSNFKGLNIPLLLLLIPWSVYFGIVWLQAVQIREEGWYAAYIPHWGDGVAHLSYMASFAYRSGIPFQHPLFLNHPFTYSFVADMIGGLLVRWGLPLWLAYNWWGFVLSIVGLYVLWRLMRGFMKSSWMATFSIYIFLLSGGLGFKYLVTEYLYPETQLKPDYFFVLLTQRPDTNIAWLNTIVGELIPQRAFLLALPVGAWLLMTWYQEFIEHKKLQLWQLLVSGLVFGCMPVIHPHTAMFVGTCGIFWGFYHIAVHKQQWIRNIQFRRELIMRAMVITIPAIMLGGWLTSMFLTASISSGFFKWYPGWLALTKQVNWVIFWWDNWGLYLPLAIMGSIRLLTKKLGMVVLPAWLWFGLTNLFLFQPYDWDNSKLLTWVYLFLAIPVVLTLRFVWRQGILGKTVAVCLFGLITLSGGLDAVKMLDTKTYSLQIVNKQELHLAEYVRNHTSPEAVFLTSTTHRNWVPILTGRQILCGYLGWMWTYGIHYDQRVRDIRNIYAGSSTAGKLIRDYGVDYIVIGPDERNEFEVNDEFFSKYPILIEDGSTTVYKIADTN